jgi:hypothetical protein
MQIRIAEDTHTRTPQDMLRKGLVEPGMPVVGRARALRNGWAVNAPATGNFIPPVSPTYGQSVLLSANVIDRDSNVSEIIYLNEGVEVGRSSTGPNYPVSWLPPGSGVYNITIKAVEYGETTEEITPGGFEVPNTLPTVALNAPTSVHLNDGTIQLTSTVDDPDGNQIGVKYYVGGQLLATSTTGPDYPVDWTPTAEGGYTITAVAYDVEGDGPETTGHAITVHATINELTRYLVFEVWQNPTDGETTLGEIDIYTWENGSSTNLTSLSVADITAVYDEHTGGEPVDWDNSNYGGANLFDVNFGSYAPYLTRFFNGAAIGAGNKARFVVDLGEVRDVSRVLVRYMTGGSATNHWPEKVTVHCAPTDPTAAVAGGQPLSAEWVKIAENGNSSQTLDQNIAEPRFPVWPHMANNGSSYPAYYIDPEFGDDSNDGSKLHPWATLHGYGSRRLIVSPVTFTQNNFTTGNYYTYIIGTIGRTTKSHMVGTGAPSGQLGTMILGPSSSGALYCYHMTFQRDNINVSNAMFYGRLMAIYYCHIIADGGMVFRSSQYTVSVTNCVVEHGNGNSGTNMMVYAPTGTYNITDSVLAGCTLSPYGPYSVSVDHSIVLSGSAAMSMSKYATPTIDADGRVTGGNTHGLTTLSRDGRAPGPYSGFQSWDRRGKNYERMELTGTVSTRYLVVQFRGGFGTNGLRCGAIEIYDTNGNKLSYSVLLSDSNSSSTEYKGNSSLYDADWADHSTFTFFYQDTNRGQKWATVGVAIDLGASKSVGRILIANNGFGPTAVRVYSAASDPSTMVDNIDINTTGGKYAYYDDADWVLRACRHSAFNPGGYFDSFDISPQATVSARWIVAEVRLPMRFDDVWFRELTFYGSGDTIYSYTTDDAEASDSTFSNNPPSGWATYRSRLNDGDESTANNGVEMFYSDPGIDDKSIFSVDFGTTRTLHKIRTVCGYHDVGVSVGNYPNYIPRMIRFWKAPTDPASLVAAGTIDFANWDLIAVDIRDQRSRPATGDGVFVENETSF